jgi:hypothetical protein
VSICADQSSRTDRRSYGEANRLSGSLCNCRLYGGSNHNGRQSPWKSIILVCLIDRIFKGLISSEHRATRRQLNESTIHLVRLV